MFSWKNLWLIGSPLLIAISWYLNSQIPHTDNFYIPTSQDIFYKNCVQGLLGIWFFLTLITFHQSVFSLNNLIASKPITAWKYLSLFCFYLSIFSILSFSLYSILFTIYGVLLIWLILSILLFVFWLVHRK